MYNLFLSINSYLSMRLSQKENLKKCENYIFAILRQPLSSIKLIQSIKTEVILKKKTSK